MGGANSGNWYRWNRKMTVEECRKIDIRYLKKIGRLYTNSFGNLNYSRGDEPTGSILYKISGNTMEINFQCRVREEDWEDVKQVFAIAETPCKFGGVRKWIVCPNCNRRITTLCQGNKYFLCRHCYDLTYMSCSENKLDRASSKQRSIIKKLGGDPYSGFPPDRPKGMHAKTYEKYWDEYMRLDGITAIALCNMMRLI